MPLRQEESRYKENIPRRDESVRNRKHHDTIQCILQFAFFTSLSFSSKLLSCEDRTGNKLNEKAGYFKLEFV